MFVFLKHCRGGLGAGRWLGASGAAGQGAAVWLGGPGEGGGG